MPGPTTGAPSSTWWAKATGALERYLEPLHSLQVTAGDFIQIELITAAAVSPPRG